MLNEDVKMSQICSSCECVAGILRLLTDKHRVRILLPLETGPALMFRHGCKTPFCQQVFSPDDSVPMNRRVQSHRRGDSY